MRLSPQARDRLAELAAGAGTRKVRRVDQELSRNGLAIVDYKRVIVQVTGRGKATAEQLEEQADVGRLMAEEVGRKRLDQLPPPPALDDPIEDGQVEDDDEDLAPFTSRPADNLDPVYCDACGREGCNLEWCLACADERREIIHLECCETHRRRRSP